MPSTLILHYHNNGSKFFTLHSSLFILHSSLFTLHSSLFTKKSTAPVSRVLYRHYCRCLSFIYYARHRASLAFYPPSHPFGNSDGPPSHGDGLHELASSSGNSTAIARCLVVSYTTFSPLPPQSSIFNLQSKKGGGCFLLPLPAVADCFYFQKWSALCRPDFPLAQSSISNLQSKKGQRQAGAVLSRCKGTKS